MTATIRPKTPRSLLIVGSAALLLLGVRLVAPHLIESVAKSQFEAIGIQGADLRVSEMSFTHISIAGIKLGTDGELEIPDLKATFSWADLVTGRMDDLTISGLKLRLTRTTSGLSFGALDPLFTSPSEPAAEASDAPIRWPLKRLILHQSSIEIRSPLGTSYLPFSGRISRDGHGVIRLEQATMSFVHPSLTVSTTLSASLAPSGQLRAALEIAHGQINIGEIRAPLTGGRFNVEGYLSDLVSFNGTGMLTVENATAPLGLTPRLGLEVKLDKGDLSADILLDDDGHSLSGSVNTVVASLFGGSPQVTLSSALSLGDLSKLPPELGLPEGITGGASLDISLTTGYDGLVTLAAAQTANQVLAALPTTRVGLRANQVALAQQPVEIWAEGNLSVFPDQGKLAIDSREGLHAWLTEREPEVFKSLFGPLHTPGNGGPLTLTLKPGIHHPLLLFDKPGTGAITVESRTEMIAQGGGLPAIIGTLNGLAQLSIPDLTLQNFSLTELRFNSGIFPVGHAKAQLKNARLTLAGTPSTFDGTFDLDLFLSGTVSDDLQMENAAATLSGPLKFDDNRLSFGSSQCSTLRIASLSWVGVGRAPNPMEFCMKGKAGEIIAVRFHDGAVERSDLFLALVGKTPRFDFIPSLGPETFVRGKPLKLDLQISSEGTGDKITAESRLSGIDIIIPQYKLTLANISLLSTGTGDSSSQTGHTTFSVDKIIDAHTPRFFTPLTFTGHLDLRNGVVESTAALEGRGHPFKTEGEGRYAIDKDEGFFTLRTLPLTFGKKNLKIGTMAPALEHRVKTLEGMVIGAAQLNWDKGNINADADVLLRDVEALIAADGLSDFGAVNLGGGQIAIKVKAMQDKGGESSAKAQILLEKATLALGGAHLEQLNAVVTFDTLSPPTTPPGQKFALALLDVGLPFTDGNGEFQLHPDGRLDLNQVSFDWFGGKVNAAPFSLGGKPEDTTIELTVEGADLQRLSTHMEVEGLNVIGLLDGVLPISIGNGAVRIKDGVLETRGPGTLSYIKSDATDNEGAGAMALQALSNFHYDKLSLLINGEVDGNVEIKTRVKGKNPDFFDGYPVDLEVGINGQLGRIAQDSLSSYQVPETIKQRMLGFGQ